MHKCAGELTGPTYTSGKGDDAIFVRALQDRLEGTVRMVRVDETAHPEFATEAALFCHDIEGARYDVWMWRCG